MFSWICPRCGRDNPPSVTRCKFCGAAADEEEQAPSDVQSVAVDEPDGSGAHTAERYETPVHAVPGAPKPLHQPRYDEEPEEPELAPAPPPPAPRRPAAPPRRRPTPPPPPSYVAPRASTPRPGLPTWLLTLLSFFAIAGIGLGIYFGVEYFRNRKAATSTGLDTAANTARTKTTSPLQKYVEVVGIRLVEGARHRPEARFVVVNHSPNDLDDLSATVTLWASTQKSEEDSVGTFRFKIGSLPGYAAKELTSPLETKLKMFELPDWQNATPDIQITSP